MPKQYVNKENLARFWNNAKAEIQSTVDTGVESVGTEIDNINAELDTKANVSHTHAISDVTNLQTTLNGKANSSHTHAIADVTDLQTTLNGKANTSHTHNISDVSGLQDELNSKIESIPVASSSVLGGINVGYTTSGKNYAVQLDENNKAFVNVNWTDTNTTYNNATTSTDGLMSSEDKAKLDSVEANANNYSLPTASDSTKGGILTGYTTSDKNYAVDVDSNGKAFVNVPWVDTNTTYSNATTSNAGLMSSADKTKLDGIAAGANKYTLTAATSTALGGVLSGGDITVSSTGTVTVNNATTADSLTTARTFALSGDVTGSGTFNGSSNVTITATVADDSHNHTIANIDNLQTTLNSKAPLASPSLTGTPTAPTANAGTNTTQIATTAFVNAAINSIEALNGALVYKGAAATADELPADAGVGYTYKASASFSIGDVNVEVGDLIVCSENTGTDPTWDVFEGNIDGAVTGPASAVNDRIATFNGSTGKVIKDGGYTISQLRASATSTANGLMTSTMVTKLNGIASGANKYTLPVAGSNLGGIKTDYTTSGKNYAVAVDSDGSAYVNVPWTDTNTTYGAATPTANGLMTSTMVTKLNGIANNANNYSLPTATSTTLGGVRIGYAESGKNYPVELNSSNQMFVNVPWTDTNTTYNDATTSARGLMTSTMVAKLNGIANNANNYSHPTSSGNKHIPSGGSSGQILRWSADGTAAWGNDNNTTYSAATTSTNGLMTSAMVTKLNGITNSADSVLISRSLTSGTKIGTITINGTATDLYCQTNTDTKYTAGTGLTLSGTQFVHANYTSAKTVGNAASPGFGGTFAIPRIIVNAQGHITSLTTSNITIPSTAASGGTSGLMTGGAQSFNGTKTFTGSVVISNTTAATSATTGALQVRGGIGCSKAIYAATGFYVTSAREEKEDIEDTHIDGLDVINKTKIVDYHYINDPEKQDRIGFIADDSDAILLNKGGDKVDLYNAIGVIMRSIQQLNNKIETLEKKLY